MSRALPGAVVPRPLRVSLPEGVRVEERPVVTDDGVTLALCRFRRGAPRRSVLLLHGLTTSTELFALPEHRNLVESLLDEDWDVWSLDWRGSNRLPYNAAGAGYHPDDVALHDIPAAVAAVRDEIGAQPLSVVAHCVGALALGISVASGLVRGLAGIAAHSVWWTPCMPESATLKMMTVLELGRRFLGRDVMEIRFDRVGFASREAVFFAAAALLHRRCRNPTCQLLHFAWGAAPESLFQHDNLLPETHERLHELLGPIPLEYQRAIRKMVLERVTVPWREDDDTYAGLARNGLEGGARHLDCPLLLLAGTENHVWYDSNRICTDRLKARGVAADVQYRAVPGYGHIDFFAGRSAALDVFPPLLEWLDGVSPPGG